MWGWEKEPPGAHSSVAPSGRAGAVASKGGVLPLGPTVSRPWSSPTKRAFFMARLTLNGPVSFDCEPHTTFLSPAGTAETFLDTSYQSPVSFNRRSSWCELGRYKHRRGNGAPEDFIEKGARQLLKAKSGGAS